MTTDNNSVPPRDPISAATHSDPYPYYANLVRHKPMYRDDGLGMWVASSAEAVEAVLRNDLCRVRPLAEPVPPALLGSPAAEIFRHLVRMTDGEAQHALKHGLSSSLSTISTASLEAHGRRQAQLLFEELRPDADVSRLDQFAFALPVYVVASLMDISPDQLQSVALWTSEFVRCLSPTTNAEHIERGKLAAAQLLDAFRAAGFDELAVLANAIGLLVQAHEATAGLIGNTLVTLARRSGIRSRAAADLALLHLIVEEVARHDPPVQNTRRFLAGDGMVAGQQMRAGDAVLLVLAAANRDPARNPDPHCFDIFRQHRQMFTFGLGVHRCPGDAIAVTIATAGVTEVLASVINVEALAQQITYRPSVNTRIPVFGGNRS